ncbi:RICIN domain-containing protein [Calidifontibacter terrae]
MGGQGGPVDVVDGAQGLLGARPVGPDEGQQFGVRSAVGKTPPTSPLFVMDITYNAYLGLYIGEPQGVDQSGNAPQEIYATDNLATPKWKLIGDTGSYTTASWYRWFLDTANASSSAIVGRSFRMYCSFGCSNGADSEYANVAIDTTAPARPVDTAATYRISAHGWLLSQQPGGSATTSVRKSAGLSSWRFVAEGDGSYRIVNAATGGLLGVDSRSTANRAWGTKPTVTPAGTAATVGQQWWVLPSTSPIDGAATGTVRIVNRYSGLVISVPGGPGQAVVTTPIRSWTGRTAGQHGKPQSAEQQTLSLEPTN